MAPEQMRSMRNADARTDIWALGVILYRALSGRRPFKGQSITEVCATVIADAPPPLGETRADLPPGLEAVVLRCLEKDPAKRFQKVSELAAALAPFAPREEETMTLTELDEIREPSPESEGATRLQRPPLSASFRDAGTARAAAWSEASGSVPAASTRGRWIAGAAVVLVGLGVAIGLGLGARVGTSGEAVQARTGVGEATAAPSTTIPPASSATATAEAAPAVSATATAEAAPAVSATASASPKASAAARPSTGAAAAPRKATPARDAFGDDRK
jgi:serine/threonine-protein kinase